jgi:aminotransferase in exopolysaccharide biosynthesis
LILTETILKNTIQFIKELYGKDQVMLHEPVFRGNEKKYLNECIDSTFVSSVGKFVDLFEQRMCEYTGALNAVVTVNGTAALHAALMLCGVEYDDEVITQPLTFIATANAVSYTGAKLLFVDVDRDTMGLSPDKLAYFIKNNCELKKDGYTYNRLTGKRIKACVPMHTFGHPARIEDIAEICLKYNIDLIEDAAESLGSYSNGRHTGLFGKMGILSFNGNKILTTGGGGMIITNDSEIGKHAKHLTTTAKLPHRWEFAHDEVGFNYRMPNINAALGCAQLELLPEFIKEKRIIAETYKNFFNEVGIDFFAEREGTISNYWLNALILKNREERDSFLEETNNNGVMTRPVWTLMNRLKMYKDCYCSNIDNAEWLEERVVNIPSGVR